MDEQLTKNELLLLSRAVLYLPYEWKVDRDRYEALSAKLKKLSENFHG
jgi:DUF1365 family protein